MRLMGNAHGGLFDKAGATVTHHHIPEAMHTKFFLDNGSSSLRASLDEAIIEAETIAQAWLERARKLRAARDELRQPLPTMNGAAGQALTLTSPEPSRVGQSSPPPPNFDYVHATIPEVVSAIMKGGGQSTMLGGEIVRRVLELRPDAAKSSIWPAIYRMVQNGRLKAHAPPKGEGGDRVYELTQKSAS